LFGEKDGGDTKAWKLDGLQLNCKAISNTGNDFSILFRPQSVSGFFAGQRNLLRREAIKEMHTSISF
jgi:hypothetical protein